MVKTFKMHPLMLFCFMRPTLIILLLPIIQGSVQCFARHDFNGVIGVTILALCSIFGIAFLRWRSYRVICDKKKQTITIEYGFVFRRVAKIDVTKLSSVQVAQNLFDFIFRAVTFKINTEAGARNRADFEFKLSKKQSKEVLGFLYREENPEQIKYSAIKIAVLAATTSSAFTGALVAVPILNRAGNLLGVALSDMLLDRISSISQKIETYFPPAINTVSLIILLAFSVSFIYSFLKYVNFRLFIGKDRVAVRSGAIVRTMTVFRKNAINSIKIEQTLIMKALKRYALKVCVGGYGSSKGEAAVIVPLGKSKDIKEKLEKHFPRFIFSNGAIKPKQSRLMQSRFLFLPSLYFIGVTALAIAGALLFKGLRRFVVFLTFVFCLQIILYAYMGLLEHRNSQISFAQNIFVRGRKGFRSVDLYCPKEKAGEIRIIRFPFDRWYKTCRVKVFVRSERADSIQVRHIDYETAKREIYRCFNIE